jgi:hypothetical protein
MLKTRISIITLIACLLLAGSTLTAQVREAKPVTELQNRSTRYFPHEFSVHVAGGLSNIDDRLDRGDRTGRLAGACVCTTTG